MVVEFSGGCHFQAGGARWGSLDVLADAVEQMEEYQEELPILYDPVKAELEALKHSMRSMIRRLNTPPAVLGVNVSLGESGTL